MQTGCQQGGTESSYGADPLSTKEGYKTELKSHNYTISVCDGG